MTTKMMSNWELMNTYIYNGEFGEVQEGCWMSSNTTIIVSDIDYDNLSTTGLI